MENIDIFQTILGDMGILEKEGKIVSIFFHKPPPGRYVFKKTSILVDSKKQIQEYFSGTRKIFTFPIEPKGTLFQQRVWNALLTIPYGETRTYKQIAEQIGSPKAFRAVGRANGLNPINIVIPCHRVIGSNGKLIGYSEGLDLKEQLLHLEGVL